MYVPGIFTMLRRTNRCSDKDRDRTAEDQGNVKAAARQVPEYAEQGREDHDKTDHAGRIFGRIAAEKYQEGDDKDPAPNPRRPDTIPTKKLKTTMRAYIPLE